MDEGGTEYDFDDLQIDAHGFTTLHCHTLAILPSLSTNLLWNEIIFVKNLRWKARMEYEWSIFNFERYWKVGTL
jgi:hypothetical protein